MSVLWQVTKSVRSGPAVSENMPRKINFGFKNNSSDNEK
jgi:hypothetical protein